MSERQSVSDPVVCPACGVVFPSWHDHMSWCTAETSEVGEPDEVEHQGWKVFVTSGRYGVRLECVTDTQPLHRMTFDFGPDDAREIAADLLRHAQQAAPEDPS